MSARLVPKVSYREKNILKMLSIASETLGGRRCVCVCAYKVEEEEVEVGG